MGKKLVNITKLDEERRKNSKTIAVMNNKGGCGKTTTALALGMYFARTGKNVLFWDNDPQSNLSQRLGLADDQHKDRRVNRLFENAGFSENNQLSLIADFPYLMRMRGIESSPGNIGLMGGSHYSEIAARALRDKLETGYGDLGHRDINRFFRDRVDSFKEYYDVIIIDTAPSLEGNALNIMSIKAANEIIYPIDGIEAGLGVKTILTWMESQIKYLDVKPNGLFAMVKYQEDTKRIGLENPEARVRNSVYRIMKESFGSFVCDTGVKESRQVRFTLPGFGGKTSYTDLCEEIDQKISQNSRPSLFEYAAQNGFFKSMEEKLVTLASKIAARKPKFKSPNYIKASQQTTIEQKDEE
jgi:chromosome partitioning protein